jgi:cell fate regulator YaaT (PSP1 superfamily)
MRGRVGGQEMPVVGRAGTTGDFRDGPQKKDSMLPEPFLREEAYSPALEKETAGYEEMTEDQLTFLKATVINDDAFDEGEDNFVIPDNAVMMDIAGIKLHHADPMLMFDSKDLQLSVGDRVVVETKKGLALGDVLKETRRCYVKQHNLPRVIRKMSQGDIRQEERNKEKEASALKLCKERIEKLRLPMKLIEVEYLHGGNKAVFYFSAEGRVDFRELVRDLAQRLHTRIEMRQIGVRDVSRIVGGVGICGCRLCCNLYLREFKPISIRMAKDQNLVLNPQKVSGVCGRLLCCLTYENEVYQKAAQSMPRVGRRVITPDGEGRIRDRDVLKRIVRVQLNEEAQLREYHVDQLEFASAKTPDDADTQVEGEETSFENAPDLPPDDVSGEPIASLDDEPPRME